MLTTVRLVLRRLRLELALCLGTSIGLSAVTLALSHLILEAKNTAAVGTWIGLVPYDLSALICLPILLGLVVGTTLVAAEFDRSTSVFAWSITPDRRRWLAETVAAGAITVLVVSMPMAVAVEVLVGSAGSRTVSLSVSEADPSGLLLLMRAMTAFSIAVVVGVLTGRSLTTLLAGVVVAAVVLGCLEVGFATWRTAAATQVDLSTPGIYFVGDLKTDANGDVLSGPVALGLEPDARMWILVDQVAATAATGAVALVLAGLLVDRRRPV